MLDITFRQEVDEGTTRSPNWGDGLMVVGQMLEDWVADSGEAFLGHDDAWVLDSGEDLGADLSQENHCGVLVIFL